MTSDAVLYEKLSIEQLPLYFWLSFVNEQENEPIGACQVKVELDDLLECAERLKQKPKLVGAIGIWAGAAALVAHRLGINPGGGVATLPLKERSYKYPVGVLMSPKEVEQMGGKVHTIGEMLARLRKSND